MKSNKKIILNWVPISKCVMLRRNPQYLTVKQMDALKASIKDDRFVSPILLRPLKNGRFEIVSGNHRFLAAQELDMKRIPAVISNMSDRDAKRLAINLNTIHGDPNPELLAPFLAEMDDDILKSIHLEDEMLQELLHFDGTLAAKLKQLLAPESIDRDSNPGNIPTCSCPRCGKKHAPANVHQDS